MSKPVVAIVGRPNVGKSTLFNVLAGERISIVKDTPGVTRDRIYADVTWLDYHFTMIDTGGIEPDSKDIILSQMREQAEIAIATADVIIFLTDVRQGLQDSDSKVADMLRRSGKPVVLVVNKVDSFEKFMPDVYEFYNLGIGDPYPISASSMLGLGDMLDEVVKNFPEYNKDEAEDERPKVAIIGKPNVGKSSLINALMNRKSYARISATPGKTQTINFYNIDDTIYLVDLPGYGYAQRSKSETEKWGKMMEDYLANREPLVQTILLVDSRHKPTKDDITMANWIRHYHTNLIVVATKMDKLKKRDIEPNLQRIWETLEMGEDDILVPFSTQDDEGKYTVWDMIEMMRAGELYYSDDEESEETEE